MKNYLKNSHLFDIKEKIATLEKKNDSLKILVVILSIVSFIAIGLLIFTNFFSCCDCDCDDDYDLYDDDFVDFEDLDDNFDE
ncbi:MAG: hypothetical protein ACK5LT_00970 [Lachnospirales bacterium]